jgi:hypothetical protein
MVVFVAPPPLAGTLKHRVSALTIWYQVVIYTSWLNNLAFRFSQFKTTKFYIEPYM